MSSDEAESGKAWVEALIKRLGRENGFEVTSAFQWHFDMDHYSYWMEVELNGAAKRWQFTREKLEDCVNDRAVQGAIEKSLVQYFIPDGQPANTPAEGVGPSNRITGHDRTEDEEATQADDRRFARIAIDEARMSVAEDDGRVHPKVGAVVVKDGRILAMAHRGEFRGCHAEYIALEKKLADASVSGATVYTTLEPCTTRNHPKVPCALRLVERRVARVVIGMVDPNPIVSGKGQRTLRKGGIAIDLFSPDLMDEVEELNRDFIRVNERETTSASTSRQRVTMQILRAVFSKVRNGFMAVIEFRNTELESEQLTEWTLGFPTLNVELLGGPGPANLLAGAPWFPLPPLDIPAHKTTRGAVFFSGYPNFMGKLPTEPVTAMLTAHLFPAEYLLQQSVDIDYIKTQLRNHQKLVFNGTSSWPPTWREKQSGMSRKGELGTLTDVRKVPPQYTLPQFLALESKINDQVWESQLHTDDQDFLAGLYEKIRSGFIGKSLTEVGSIELP